MPEEATPQRLVELMSAKAGFPTEVVQEDDGSGYLVLEIGTPYGSIRATIDTGFQPGPDYGGAEEQRARLTGNLGGDPDIEGEDEPEVSDEDTPDPVWLP